MLQDIQPGIFFIAYVFERGGKTNYTSMELEFSKPDTLANIKKYVAEAIKRQNNLEPREYSIICWSRLQ